MTKTTNYQLNQWEKEDRIQMEDFNADNEKIDTALTALDRSAKLHTILDETTTEDCTRYDRRLNIDWSEWKTVYIDVVPAPGSAGDLRICYSGHPKDSIVDADTTWNHIIGFPCGNAEMPLYFLVFQGNSGSFRRCPYTSYKHFQILQLMNENGTGLIKAGTHIRMLGEKM